MYFLYLCRIYFKLLLRRFFLIPSFCRHCGRDVHDFTAPNEVWLKVEPHIKRGHTLCYACFCELCAEYGLPVVWELKEIVSNG